MARIRTIKPEFWTNEKLVECSMSARLFFIGMLNFADDNGNLDYSIKKLKMQIFPADTVECENLIQELIANKLLVEYSSNDRKYLHIKGFKSHQRIDRPSITCIPEPSFVEPSTSPRSVKEGKVVEGKGNNNALTRNFLNTGGNYGKQKPITGASEAARIAERILSEAGVEPG